MRLMLRRRVAVQLERAAADRLAAQAGDSRNAPAVGRARRRRRSAAAGVEAAVEARVELAKYARRQ